MGPAGAAAARSDTSARRPVDRPSGADQRGVMADSDCCYGHWKTVYNRHRRWSTDRTWDQILAGLRRGCDQDENQEWALGVDSTVTRAHQHAAGARRRPPKHLPGGGIE